MSTPCLRLCIPAALIAFVAIGCGGDDDPTIDSAAAVVAETADVPLPAGTGDIPLPVGTGDIPLPVGTGDIPLPPDTSDIPMPTFVEVTVGLDSSPDRVVPVPLGTTVTLSVLNPTSDDEFHLHGYELGDGLKVLAGTTQTFTFTASTPGEFELESHETGDVLLVLSVA
jgi:hypothetical protein